MSIHILRTPMVETKRQPHGDERWCFVCRTRRLFDFVIETPIDCISCPWEPGVHEWEFGTGAYYGPSALIECAICHTTDGDCFPGTGREWKD